MVPIKVFLFLLEKVVSHFQAKKLLLLKKRQRKGSYQFLNSSKIKTSCKMNPPKK